MDPTNTEMAVSEVEPLRGRELLRVAVNQIIAHPETWNQRSWHCGTQHCIAGHCQLIGGRRLSDESASFDAAELLGLERADADWLFRGDRTREEIYNFAKAFIAGEPFFNRDGYNRDGYDRDGYNRVGYDRDGYNRVGYNRVGYNRDGYDRDWYNRDGYDRDGYNRDGAKLPLL